MSERDAFDRILESMQKASLDDAQWSATSALIDEACGTKGNGLVYGEGNFEGYTRIFLTRFMCQGQRNDELEREYFDVYHSMDERLPRIRRLPDSQVVHVSDLFTEEELETSVVYNELLPLNNQQNGLHGRLDGPNGSRIVWTMGDPIDSDGWTSPRTKMVRRLLPHLRHHIIVRHALAEAGALGASLIGLLQLSEIGIIQLDAHGRIVAATDCARNLLLDGICLFDQNGHLFARAPHDDTALQRVLARALPPFGKQGVGGSILINGVNTAPGLVVHVSPVGQGHRDIGAYRIAALVLVVEPAGLMGIDPTLLENVLDLTTTESRVAALLAEGRTVRDIAARLARSEHTIRWHVRQIYDKHGISREVELVRLVLSVAGSPDKGP